MRSALARHAPFAAIFLFAASLRLYGLAWLPSPAGDEGNWTWLAARISRGVPSSLDPDANFVTLLHARLMALSMRALGPTFFAARLVGVLATLLAVAAAYAIPTALGSRRAGLAASVTLAVHPWAVFWARTASVPYALGLAVMTVGPLLFTFGLVRRRALWVALAIGVMAVGADFSPLTVIAAAACGAFAVRAEHRWVLRRWEPYVAIALGLVHVLPIVRAAVHVARSTPQRDQLGSFGDRLASFAQMVGTGLAGEATVRHFTDVALSPQRALWLVLPIVATVAVAALPRVRRASPLPGFASSYLLLGVVLMPLLLAPGREWHLARIDTDRYLFALIPAFALCVGDVAAAARGFGWPVLAATIATLATASARAMTAFISGGGPDLGVPIAEGGGGYRGWKVAREHESTVVLVRETVRREAGPAGAMTLIGDWAFHPIHFANTDTNLPAFDVRVGPIPDRADGKYFFLLWSDAMFTAPGSPRSAADDNARLRARMYSEFVNARRVRTFVQPNGYPLFELWRAERVR